MKKVFINAGVRIFIVVVLSHFLWGCHTSIASRDNHQSTSELLAGAASASILPTVNGTYSYLDNIPDISESTNPLSPGLYVEAFDQGIIDIDNGMPDAAWVHDDIRAAALAISQGDSKVVLVSSDVYMITAADGAEIIRRAKVSLPLSWQHSEILISSTHNHHGPGTMFSVNKNWYELMANQTVSAIINAVSNLEPAVISIAQGEHRFGVNDARDPIIIDPAAHVLYVTRKKDQSSIATTVQWNSHVESTLSWEPKTDLSSICKKRKWPDETCSAEGRYITADYPGEMRAQLQHQLGGEVLYMVGAIGSQIGPGKAPVWRVDDAHPIGNGWTVPDGALPIAGANSYLDKNFSKAEVIGEQLAKFVIELKEKARPLSSPKIQWREESFYSRLHQLGFRALLAQGALAWQGQELYLCNDIASDSNCVSDNGAVVDDPIAGKVRKGEYLKSRVGYLSLDDNAGMLFMPGEFPPEFVIGLPKDFIQKPEKWYRDPVGQHAMGVNYKLPGYINNLNSDEFIMPIGLGNDELGYWVPLSDIRIPCAGDLIGGDGTCKSLYEKGFINWPAEVAGSQCKTIIDNDGKAIGFPDDVSRVLEASCKYGLMLGKTSGYTEGHYEETNSAGWDLMTDSWRAYEKLFGKESTRQVNPKFHGFTPEYPEQE